jgi:hypothetical protein
LFKNFKTKGTDGNRGPPGKIFDFILNLTHCIIFLDLNSKAIVDTKEKQVSMAIKALEVYLST